MAVFSIGIALVGEGVSDLTPVVTDKLYASLAVVGAEHICFEVVFRIGRGVG